MTKAILLQYNKKTHVQKSYSDNRASK